MPERTVYVRTNRTSELGDVVRVILLAHYELDRDDEIGDAHYNRIVAMVASALGYETVAEHAEKTTARITEMLDDA